jgi:hypothetical protein
MGRTKIPSLSSLITCSKVSTTSTLVVRNETEDRCFEAFREDFIPEISGIWDCLFWESIVLTACDEPFIRDVVLAIAAINLSIKEDRKKPRTLEGETGSSKISTKHY